MPRLRTQRAACVGLIACCVSFTTGIVLDVGAHASNTPHTVTAQPSQGTVTFACLSFTAGIGIVICNGIWCNTCP